jgi:hypothetical protein
MRLVPLVLALLAACGSNPVVRALRVEQAMPDYGPLGGGTVIALHGTGFATTARVLLGGREAPLVRALDDTRLELVIPPGEQPGDVDVVVFGDAGSVAARGIFRYSIPPSITAISPFDVVGASTDTVITVTGAGFADEGAGDNYVLVDGQPIAKSVVTSDTTMTFVAPAGRVFARPAIEIINQRGRTVAPRAYRYTPGPRPGLLLFRAGATCSPCLRPRRSDDRADLVVVACSSTVHVRRTRRRPPVLGGRRLESDRPARPRDPDTRRARPAQHAAQPLDARPCLPRRVPPYDG